ncbi:hypothetical protein RI578_01220 [Streptomyces sp. BB1-1-1]|uniref:hypothetical protein n=1 Tax=Streptomyces sp. BB1-1-1 TaxID=3074430 RepID=UPI0028779F80|nr:hypothetical protein [Streptomyces sp. BB1-1-1]WND32988.1 hypothetical protein RI578_01220 [Streptomyces sp. BB1-1-1]
MPHRGEKRQMYQRAVEGVLVHVAADLVGGVHRGGDHDPPVGEGARWHQVPRHLGPDVQRLGPHEPGQRVAGGAFAGDEQRQETGETVCVLAGTGIVVGGTQAQQSQTLGPVHHRHPPDGVLGFLRCDRREPAQLEGPPGRSAVDPNIPVDARWDPVRPGQQMQFLAPQIRHIDEDVGETGGLGVLAGPLRQRVERHQMTGVQ